MRLILTFLLLFSSGVAEAAMLSVKDNVPDLVFSDKNDPKISEIVFNHFPELKNVKDSKIEYAVGKISDNDQIPSVFVVVKSTSTCFSESCRHIVFRYQKNRWSVVFDRKISSVKLGKSGFGTVRDIVANNGYEVWSWTGDSYKMNFSSFSEKVDFKDAPTDYWNSLSDQFGPGYYDIIVSHSGKVQIAPFSLNSSEEKQYFVKLVGDVVCAREIGCPWKILSVQNGSYVVLSSGYSSGDVFILPVARGGWRDVASEMVDGGNRTKFGFTTYGWSGKSYEPLEYYSFDGGVK